MKKENKATLVGKASRLQQLNDKPSTFSDTIEDTIARDDLCRRIKQRYAPGPALPTLVLVRAQDHNRSEEMKIGWQHYAGMGNYEIREANATQRKAAEQLFKKGDIAPTRLSTHYNDIVSPLKLLEDLNWGLDANDGIIQYELQGGANRQDIVLRDDRTFGPAINAIRTRLGYGHAAIDSPIRIQDQVIRPIILDRQYALIRARQNEFNPT